MGEETLASESSVRASRPGGCEVQPTQTISRPSEAASRRSPVVSEGLDNLGADGAPARLGIMGGTFDPIHIGHLACAEQVREAYGLDAVVFIPAGSPVFKRDRDVTPADDRLAMCRLATESNPAFDVSAMEIERGGDTCTTPTTSSLCSSRAPTRSRRSSAGTKARRLRGSRGSSP